MPNPKRRHSKSRSRKRRPSKRRSKQVLAPARPRVAETLLLDLSRTVTERGARMVGTDDLRALIDVLVAAYALYTGQKYILPFAAAAMLWGHYWDASNCMTIPTMVARPQYRGTASGFAYMFVKLPSFLAIFLFPTLFAAIGQASATLFVAIFPLIGLLAAIFILPEVYGYEQD